MEEHATAETAATEGEHSAEASAELCHSCEVVPFLRGSATDLNFPFALAFITVVMTQVYGVWALGPSYFEKYFQFKALISGGPFGAINFAVGLLEVILEFAKILSFGFRLFGNIFAGALLAVHRGRPDGGCRTGGPVPVSKSSLASSRLMCSSCWLPCSPAEPRSAITAAKSTTNFWNHLSNQEKWSEYDMTGDIVEAMSLLGAGLAMLGAIGAGVGVGIAASGGVQAMGRNPDATPTIQTNMILGMAFAEAVAIYALAVALIIIFAA